MKRLASLTVLLVLAILMLAACGGDSDDESTDLATSDQEATADQTTAEQEEAAAETGSDDPLAVLTGSYLCEQVDEAVIAGLLGEPLAEKDPGLVEMDTMTYCKFTGESGAYFSGRVTVLASEEQAQADFDGNSSGEAIEGIGEAATYNGQGGGVAAVLQGRVSIFISLNHFESDEAAREAALGFATYLLSILP